MALDVLGWSKELREDVNFVLESKLLFTQATETNWRNKSSYFTVKMAPVSALLVTLGRNSLEPPPVGADLGVGGASIHATQGQLNFPRETGVRQAALLLIREKNSRYSMVRVGFL